jgi:type IV secretory pathway VirB2 component (pilin)
MFLFCAVVATGITEGTPALDWTWALVFIPSVLGMIFFGLATVVLGNNEVDS